MDKISFDVNLPGELTTKKVFDLFAEKRAFINFIFENKGKQINVVLEADKRTSKKLQMYAYLNGVLIPFATKLFRQSGDMVDSGQTMINLKVMFAKDIITTKEGDTALILLSQSDMNKDRLLTFIKDIILFLEMEFGVDVPDSDEYKISKLNHDTGRQFQKINKTNLK